MKEGAILFAPGHHRMHRAGAPWSYGVLAHGKDHFGLIWSGRADIPCIWT